MRTLPTPLKNQLRGQNAPAAWLVQIGTTYYLALYAADITFDGQVYSAHAGTVEQQAQTLEGRAPRLVLSLANIDRVLRDWLKAADRRGTEVTLTVVSTDYLADATAKVSATFDLDAWTCDEAEAKLQLASSPTVRGVKVPGRIIQDAYCPFTYKGTECGYVGDLAACDFTYDGPNGCKKHFGESQPKRFGAFIGLARTGLAVR